MEKDAVRIQRTEEAVPLQGVWWLRKIDKVFFQGFGLDHQ